jgi:hypothetical protein
MRPLQAFTAFGEECERDEHYDGHGDNKYIKHTVPPRELVDKDTCQPFMGLVAYVFPCAAKPLRPGVVKLPSERVWEGRR